MDPISFYLHIPFCKKRCSYCDFVTYAGCEDRIQPYIDALCEEIKLIGQTKKEKVILHSIFIGGGTPTILPLTAFEQIFLKLQESFEVKKDCEISIEANPGTLNLGYLQGLKKIGFNRISLGVQSAHPQDLFLLERIHDYSQVNESVRNARLAGFGNLNLDLIYGIPQQTMERWLETLSRTLELEPEHLSFYALTLENNVPMQRWVERGLLEICSDDLMAEMYEAAEEVLKKAGYFQYEISNWARQESGTTFMCRHNLQYWRNKPYLGLGAGAHGYVGGFRTVNTPSINDYINRLEAPISIPADFPFSPANLETLEITRDDEIQETLMVGLRLTQEGVSRKAFNDRFGLVLDDFYGKEIFRLLNQGLLENAGQDGDILRLSKKARLLGNQVFMQFLKV